MMRYCLMNQTTLVLFSWAAANQEKAGFPQNTWNWVKGLFNNVLNAGTNAVKDGKKLAKEDPRRVVHSLKVGLAITLVSLFYYFDDPLYDGFGVSAMWAVMTVAVVFEFSVGMLSAAGLSGAITGTGKSKTLGLAPSPSGAGKLRSPIPPPPNDLVVDAAIMASASHMSALKGSKDNEGIKMILYQIYLILRECALRKKIRALAPPRRPLCHLSNESSSTKPAFVFFSKIRRPW